MSVAKIVLTNGSEVSVEDPELDFDLLREAVLEGGWLSIGERAVVSLRNVCLIELEEGQ